VSVTFRIEGVPVDYDDRRTFVNFSNLNARDLLEWLGCCIGPALIGTVNARDLAARCRRRLWDEPRNHDPAVLPISSATGRFTLCGRPAGGLRARCQELLELAEAAQERRIHFG
jgi:hypothetical protein